MKNIVGIGKLITPFNPSEKRSSNNDKKIF